MSEIDPLVFKLIADTKAAQAEARRTATTMGQSFGRVERDILKLENQMKRSSGAIAGQLRGLAGTLGTAFGAREIGQIIDNFTRLQNSLKVSGLEGEALGRVQERLLELSGRYGVSINELANLYGKASQSGKELGASEAQLLQITEASAQALKISGTSAAQAQGALLGLSQALAAGTVRAEEYNQILEGGLQPLLQVAANTDKYGGSLARLRQAVIDGKVSSQELFDSILAGSAQLDAQASKATLTLAGAFEALASQLTVYVGQSAEASGVTAALAGGIKLLADNLDIIIPALALIAATMGTSLVVNALAGSRAFFALTAAMAPPLRRTQPTTSFSSPSAQWQIGASQKPQRSSSRCSPRHGLSTSGSLAAITTAHSLRFCETWRTLWTGAQSSTDFLGAILRAIGQRGYSFPPSTTPSCGLPSPSISSAARRKRCASCPQSSRSGSSLSRPSRPKRLAARTNSSGSTPPDRTRAMAR